MNIREHAIKAIYGGMPATKTDRNGQAGVLFHDENEFIPFDDLNYNNQLGYYRMSQFPNAERECTNELPDTIHRYDSGDDWQAFVWCDDSGTLHMLGEHHQVVDLYNALKLFVENGVMDDEIIDDENPLWSHMKDIKWAVNEAIAFGLWDDPERAANSIRAAARRQALPGAVQEDRNWYFHARKFRAWLLDEDAHKTGPKPSTPADLIEGFDGDVSGLQHELAAMAREATGNIPRGQLWQPCEHRGCNNEPVCMNCMMCQEKHCHCFD